MVGVSRALGAGLGGAALRLLGSPGAQKAIGWAGGIGGRLGRAGSWAVAHPRAMMMAGGAAGGYLAGGGYGAAGGAAAGALMPGRAALWAGRQALRGAAYIPKLASNRAAPIALGAGRVAVGLGVGIGVGIGSNLARRGLSSVGSSYGSRRRAAPAPYGTTFSGMGMR